MAEKTCGACGGKGGTSENVLDEKTGLYKWKWRPCGVCVGKGTVPG